MAEDDYGITMICPVQPDQSWQARAGQGFDKSQFHIDWTTHTVTCPMGHTNRFWIATLNPRGQPVIRVKFDQSDCLACPERPQCTRNSSRAGRGLTLLADERQARTLQHARQVQQTEAFQQTYTLRAGVEGTFSQAASVFGLRYTRYRGLAKTHLQYLLTAAAMNLVRAFAWCSGVPRATTSVSRLAALAA
jgi:transposase